jgi:hypothetical protein
MCLSRNGFASEEPVKTAPAEGKLRGDLPCSSGHGFFAHISGHLSGLRFSSAFYQGGLRACADGAVCGPFLLNNNFGG